MGTTAKVLKYAAFGVLIVVAVLGGAFAAGYAFQDLPFRAAALGTVIALAFIVTMSVLALRRTDVAVTALLVITAGLSVLALVDGRWDVFTRDVNGPVMTVLLLITAAPLAVLGLRRAFEAGVMILILGVAQLVGTGIAHAVASGQFEWGLLLRGSGGVVVLPLLLGGLLFILAGRSDHETPHFLPTHGAHAIH
ncbi:MAG: hypothetical protein WCA30_17815 [Dermatophilaceae bacterium]